MDRLVAAILSLEAGEEEQRLETLTSASPPALREYLEGRRLYRQGLYRSSAEAYQRALQIDTAFALAGIGLSEAVAMGTGPGFPSGSRGLELAWASRDRLGRADREYLGLRRGPGVPVGVEEEIRRWERATSVLPDRAEVWYVLGDRILHSGAMVDMSDYLDRAAAAFDRAVALDSALFVALQHRHWVAELQDDTARIRRLVPVLSSLSPGGLSATLVRWSEAGLEGDSAALDALRAAIDTAGFDEALILHYQVYFGAAGAVRVEDAARALDRLRAAAGTGAQREEAASIAHAFALNRGRPQDALRLSAEEREDPDATARLRERALDALYWDGDPSAGQEAVDRLAAVLAGRGPLGELDTAADFQSLCVLEQWRLWHGQAGSANDAGEALRAAAADSTSLGVHNGLCARLLDVLAVRSEGPSPGLLDRTYALDSILRTGPPVSEMRRQANIVAARIFEELGETRRAYAAARRVLINWGGERYFVPRLRQRARLAALSGDRDAAIDAYRLYLEFRDDPESALRAQVDSVRTELATLEGGG